jgi:hypothetical protein
MKKIVLGTLMTVAITIASGILQGSLSNRWGASQEQRRVGAKLEQCPKDVPNWKLHAEKPLEQVAIDQLIPYGYFQREYVSCDSGDMVSVTVIVGPSGTLSVHTPEVCYAGLNFDQLEERKVIDIPDPSGQNTIWKVALRSKKVDQRIMENYYAWSEGDRWVAAENPRYSFATRPYIYKIQLQNISQADPAGKANPSVDPSIRFLTDFLPILQKYLEKPASR